MSESPYPGLRSFRQDEHKFFFGRDEHVNQLLENLSHDHFLAVIGPSGYGKSSLVRTGLINALQAGFLSTAGTKWYIVDFHPGEQPFEQLADALLKCPVFKKAFQKEVLLAELQQGPLSLQNILQNHPLPSSFKLLLLVDQFEEIIIHYQKNKDSKELKEVLELFISWLLQSKQYPHIYIVVTMRSDYLGECSLFHGLPEVMDRGSFLVPRLTNGQLRDAISEPVKVCKGIIEDTLVNALLTDVRNRYDQLPLLQHALMRMWNLAKDENTKVIKIRTEHYEKIGKLELALSNHAEEAYDELNPENVSKDKDYKERNPNRKQKIARILFQGLCERGCDRLDKRRYVPLKKMTILANQSIGEVSEQEVIEVIEVFRKTDRHFMIPLEGDLNSESIINITHESLIRQWPRLKTWAEEDALAVKYCQHLTESALEWDKTDHEGRKNRDNEDLLKGNKLNKAIEWKTKHQFTEAWAKRYGFNFLLIEDFLRESLRMREVEEVNEKRLKKEQLQRESGYFWHCFWNLLKCGWNRLRVIFKRRSGTLKPNRGNF